MFSEDKKNRIMEFAFKKFISESIPQITMDDIAKGVGMGKGTLYQYFPSKEDLVMHTMDFIAANIEKKLDTILDDNKLTPVEKLTLFLKTIAGRLASLNPSTLDYLERCMPSAFEKIGSIRQHIIEDKLGRLLTEGKRTGLFDPTLDDKLVPQMMVGAVNQILHTHSFDKVMTSDQLFHSIISILLRGCLTEEGRKLAKDRL